jgi:hypothetical protein
MSFALYEYISLDIFDLDELKISISIDETKVKDIQESFASGSPVPGLEHERRADKVIDNFNNYHPSHDEWNYRDYMDSVDNADLEFALSQIFSKSQKELVRKRLMGDKLTKTEREYYSRVVKKKLFALANLSLHRLANKLIKN